ncbi:ATP-grasp domain-containing protein [Garicola koreensis]|uniref:D-alanine-D-alanine ligase-like ATP-grasp enzyme n=1 Tax=Garicola koreensis TaxID=1262554 RepID=A0A7W5TUS9_9MICC|nr:ATP-grasp domain-containing protein [Garicola koreensis]MBB3667224.1 D-alanine-D-alanine ligase-like ATP-grasp enzyme [Garicola koreensis]
MSHKLTRDLASLTSQGEPNEYSDARSLELTQQSVQYGRNLGAATIAYAAEQQGANLDWLTTRSLWAVFNDRRVAILGHFGTESWLASAVVGDKLLAKELMKAAGVSVPAGRGVSSAEDAIQAQQEIGQSVVLKPVHGNMGRGVTVNVTDPDDIREGFVRAAKGKASVLVEQYIDVVAEYRAHASSTACEGVFRRLLPNITGDGHSTVVELIEQKNEIRRHNPSTRLAPIPIDAVAEGFLRRRGLTLDSVLPQGRRVDVRDVNGITSGGDSEQCWDLVSDPVKQTAVAAVAAIPGMDWGGVDLVVDHKTGIPYVIEVNSDAAINGSTFPVFGAPRDLGKVLWRRMYARSTPEPTGAAQIPKLLDVPRRLGFSFDTTDGEKVTLSDLMQRKLRANGCRIINHNRRIWSAETPEEDQLWFGSVLNESDPAIAIYPVRRPLLLREILRKSRVARPASRRVQTREQLAAFCERVGDSVSVMPARKSLGRAHSKLIERVGQIDESILAGSHNWFVQARRPGLRFSVIASPHEALAVIAPSEQASPSENVVEEVAQLAARAVRAVPHLRWAVVDVMRRYPEHETRKRPNAVVEELSLNPTFSGASELVAGSMDKVLDLLIAGARPSAPDGAAGPSESPQ